MDELEELKKERDKLEAEREVREEFRKRDAEKRKLKKEIWTRKNPKKTKAIEIARRSAGGVKIMLGGIGKAVAPALKQGSVNFASNFNRPSQTPRRTIKTKRRIKTKKKKGGVKRRSVSRMPSYEDFFY